MEEEDARFSTIGSDPRFKVMRKRERKVKIDRRFEAMFKDKKFKIKSTIDKRGRPVQQRSDETLKRFYDLSDSDSGLSDDEAEEDKLKGSKTIVSQERDDALRRDNGESGKLKSVTGEEDLSKNRKSQTKKRRRSGREELKLLLLQRKKLGNQKKGKTQGMIKQLEREQKEVKQVEGVEDNGQDDSVHKVSVGKGDLLKNPSSSVSSSSDSSDEDDSSDEAGPSNDRRVDYSRGEVLMESSSSDESDSEGNDDVDVEHRWGELDTEAKRTEEISSRLAVCNMDWDRITANDILVLLSSFKPPGSIIKSVKIYVSDLGLERIKDEDIHGPRELVEKDEKFENLGELAEKKYFREKLRKYQLQRLKYFYGVVECDSVQTAGHIYEQCDGYEFESSAVKLDLRFIPDDMTFDREPKEVAESDSLDLDFYKPSEFVNSALQQSKVNLTWDEDDPDRIKNTKGSFNKEELEKADFKAYLASSSEEDDSEGEDNQGSDEEGDLPHLTEEERLEKYKSLVKDLEREKEEEDVDAEMEITWEPALKETTEDLVTKKLEEEETDNSPWQQYLNKKKEKKKERKETEQREKEKNIKLGGGSDGEDAFSDDELPEGVDLNDPFFSSEEPKDGKKNRKGSKRRNERDDEDEEEEEDKLKRKAELELLMMDDEDNKQHFNLKDIMEKEKPKKKKRRKKRTQDEDDDDKVEDTFEVDVKDSRFDAIYSSHHFAIDPSDPHFKRTKSMQAIMEEKQTRRARGESKITKTHQLKDKETKLDEKVASKSEVSALIKSIKRNTSNMAGKGQPRSIKK